MAPPLFSRKTMKRRRIPEISEDLLWCILLRLPLRALFRCKTVCKAWSSIISDPGFRTDYRIWQQHPLEGEYAGFFHSCTKPSGRGFIQFVPGGSCSSDKATQEVILSAFGPRYYPYPECTEVRVLAASSGVLLCGVKLLVPCFSSSNRNPEWAYYVCNPFTREWRSLPPYQATDQHAAIGFVCQEDEGSRYRYEVVRINGPRFNFVETYCSRCRGWTTASFSSDREWVLATDSPAVVAGGVYHWTCNDDFLVSYDPASNRLEDRVELPDESVGRSAEWLEISIGVDAGTNLICYLLDHDGIDMWVRGHGDGRDGFLWWRKHRVEWIHLQETIFSYAGGWFDADDIEVKVFPGNPDKILIDWSDAAISYEWGSGIFQMLFNWEGRGTRTKRSYFPYYKPFWRFKL